MTAMTFGFFCPIIGCPIIGFAAATLDTFTANYSHRYQRISLVAFF
jgi:hypothetical protein